MSRRRQWFSAILWIGLGAAAAVSPAYGLCKFIFDTSTGAQPGCANNGAPNCNQTSGDPQGGPCSTWGVAALNSNYKQGTTPPLGEYDNCQTNNGAPDCLYLMWCMWTHDIPNNKWVCADPVCFSIVPAPGAVIPDNPLTRCN